MLKSIRVVSLCLLALALALSALPLVPTPPAAARQDGVTLRLPGGGYWGHPSPFGFSRGPGYMRASLIFDTLVWRDASGQTIPWLATDWTRSDDGLTWTFTLREGVTWHDGQPLTVDDVVFSFQTYLDHPELVWFMAQADVIDSVAAVGDHQVAIVLKQPYAPFLQTTAEALFIFPRHIWENVADPKAYAEPEAFVGSGAYRLVEYSQAEGTYLFEANPDFFLGAPYVARIQSLERLIDALDQEIDLFARLARGKLVADPGYRAVTFDQVHAAYLEQATALIEGGVDLRAERVVRPRVLGGAAPLGELEQPLRLLLRVAAGEAVAAQVVVPALEQRHRRGARQPLLDDLGDQREVVAEHLPLQRERGYRGVNMNSYNIFWRNMRFEQIWKRLTELGPTSRTVVMLGDSITEGFPEKDIDGYTIVNEGINSDSIDHPTLPIGIIRRLDLIKLAHPEHIFFLIGINDICDNETPDDLEPQFIETYDALKTTFPNVKIHITPIFPVAKQYKHRNPVIDEMNVRIRRLAEERGFDIMDLTPLLKDSEGNMKEELTLDGVHVNNDTYKLWISAVSDKLKASEK